uniref:Uncharacterized protein n=1 Tax=Lepeophtheirus salmonis TaxID=72036 RepID=A0A0K2VDQ1_LEPSM
MNPQKVPGLEPFHGTAMGLRHLLSIQGAVLSIFTRMTLYMRAQTTRGNIDLMELKLQKRYLKPSAVPSISPIFRNTYHPSNVNGLHRELPYQPGFLKKVKLSLKLATFLLKDCGFEYFLPRQVQNDFIEARFSWDRQLSGANYFVSVCRVLEGEKKI